MNTIIEEEKNYQFIDRPQTTENVPYKTQFRLFLGDIIHIGGIPYEYLGDGLIGTNTPLQNEETIKENQSRSSEVN